MKIAAGSERSLRQLLPVFESAIHLLVLGEFEAAADCFEFIARDFPSREILNNAGVARAMEAISLFPGGEFRYAYPVELDGESRLAQGQVRGGSSTREVAKRREKLLVAAKTLFQHAHLRDAEYTPAIVNLACVAQLAGNAAEALVHAQEAVALAKSQSDKVSLANAHLILGLFGLITVRQGRRALTSSGHRPEIRLSRKSISWCSEAGPPTATMDQRRSSQRSARNRSAMALLSLKPSSQERSKPSSSRCQARITLKS